MRNISSVDALRELNNWNSKSRVGCIYTVRELDAVFSVRRGSTEIRDSDIFVDASDANALMHLEDCEFSLRDPEDLPFVLKKGFPPLPETHLRVTFRNGDVCFFFPD